MNAPKGPTLTVVPNSKGDPSEATPRALQPSGWPIPRGYANGMIADGRIVVTGGVIGWDAEEKLKPDFVSQVRQALQPLPPPPVVRWGIGAITALALVCGLGYSFGIRQDLALHTQLRTVVAHICVGGTPIVALTLTLYACLWNHFHENRPKANPQAKRSMPLD